MTNFDWWLVIILNSIFIEAFVTSNILLSSSSLHLDLASSDQTLFGSVVHRSSHQSKK